MIAGGMEEGGQDVVGAEPRRRRRRGEGNEEDVFPPQPIRGA